MTDLKQTPSLDWMDAPIKAPIWKNVYFLKDGTTRTAKNTWPTRGTAKHMLEEFLAGHYAYVNPNTGGKYDGWKAECFIEEKEIKKNSELSYVIQLPWKE